MSRRCSRIAVKSTTDPKGISPIFVKVEDNPRLSMLLRVLPPAGVLRNIRMRLIFDKQ